MVNNQFEIRQVSVNQLKTNNGQIDGLPKNPRFIRDDKFKKLCQSLKDSPEMLNLRELIAVEYKGSLVVIAGNMRLRAAKDVGIQTLPVKILPFDTAVEKLREYTIKDNVGFGEHDYDILANEWDEVELTTWGLDVPIMEEEPSEEEPKESVKEPSLVVTCANITAIIELFEELKARGEFEVEIKNI